MDPVPLVAGCACILLAFVVAAAAGFWWGRLPRAQRWAVRGVVALVVALGVWRLFQSYPPQESNAVRAAIGETVTIKDDVENLPASAYNAIPFDVPTPGTIEISITVVRGNPIDVFVTTPDQLETVKKLDWGHVRVFGNFNAVKTKVFKRTEGSFAAGVYYVVLRDLSLGILSQSASDVAVKIRLNP